MDIQTLDCDKILFPGTDETTPSFQKDLAEIIALSIETDRLYHPIAVRADPDKPHCYRGVHGRHRLHAQYRILKRSTIDCVVLDMDDEDAASAAQAENAFRREMSWAERALVLRAWYRQYKAKHPERVGRGQAGLAAIRRLKAAGTRGAARNGNPRERSDQKSKSPCKNNGHANGVANDDQTANLNHGNNGHANGVANDDQTANLNHGNNGHANGVANDDQTANLNHGNNEGETEGADRVRTFAEIVAAVIGVSTSTAKRMQRIFLNLNDEQIQVCDRLDLPLGAIDSIAALKDAGQRAALINLIDSGTPFDKAWEKIAPDARRSTGKSRAREAAEARAAQERQSELSDDDWFTAHCAGTTNALADPARFKADALLFRRVVNACRLFGSAVQEALDEAAPRAHADPFHDLILRCAHVDHPRDWIVCDACKGSGCAACRGAGYHLGNPLPSSAVAAPNDDTDTVSTPDAPAPVQSMPVASAEVDFFTPIDPSEDTASDESEYDPEFDRDDADPLPALDAIVAHLLQMNIGDEIED